MRFFQDTFETRKRSFIITFFICMTVPFKSFKSPEAVLPLNIFKSFIQYNLHVNHFFMNILNGYVAFTIKVLYIMSPVTRVYTFN